MLYFKETIVVEGVYDKIKLANIVDANIVVTNGFAIFHDEELISMLKRLAEKSGLIVLTDSDRAGFLIRNYIKNIIPKEQVKHAYIPNIAGKEKRKDQPSREGFLGVEGVSNQVIAEALSAAAVAESEKPKDRKPITKVDLFEDGLSGGVESRQLREKLCNSLSLPVKISANGLLDVLNTLFSYEEYKNEIENLKR